MADTLESIFLNTSLGATELDDGEHTLVTTNSTTSFVIKDMHVNGTSLLTNTHLELNGFNVSGITSNATGSLIIPPNSTLKLKTTDYPYNFYEIFRWMNNDATAAFNLHYEDSKGTTYGTPVAYYSNGNLQQSSGITDVHYMGNDTNGNPYAFYTANDGNSSQYLKYWRVDNDSHGNITTGTYKPFGIYDKKAYYFSSNNLLEHNLFTNATSPNFNQMSTSGSFNNSYSINSGSSYPRARASHGWFWYIPNSGYNQFVYGIRIEGSTKGNWHSFQMTRSSSLDGSKNFVVSVDETNDKLYFYHVHNGSSIRQNVFNNYSTLRDNDSSNIQTHTSDGEQELTSNTGGAFASGGAFNALGINGVDVSNLSDSNLGFLRDGGFTFKSSSNSILVESRADLTPIAATENTITAQGNTINQGNRGHWKKETKLTSSQMTALGLSAPTFGLQLLGVRSTV